MIPPSLQHPPLVAALEAARTASFTREEWDAYIVSGMAIQNERGALSLARREGLEEGIRQGIVATCDVLGIEIDAERSARLAALDAAGLEALLAHLRRERRWP